MKTKLFLSFIFILLQYCSNHNTKYATSNPIISKWIEIGKDRKRDYNERMFYNKKAFLELKNKNDSISREQLFEIGWSYFYMNNLEEFKTVANNIKEKSIKKRHKNHLGRAFRFFGLFYEKKSMNDSAFFYYEKAKKIFQTQRNSQELCKNYQDKAYVQLYVNDFLGSDQSLITALKIAKKEGMIIEEYSIYRCLGSNSFELGDIKKAIEYYNKALDFYKRINLYSENIIITSCKANLGICYSTNGEFKLAIKTLEEAMKENNLKLKAPTTYCSILDNISLTKMKLKEYKEVEIIFLKSSRIRDSLNIDQGKNFNKLYLSQYYIAVKDTSKAITYAHEAFDLSQSFKAPKDMLLCLKQLAIVEPKKALKYSQDYIRISDSMQRLERLTRNKFAKIAYETEEITIEKESAVHQKWIFLGISVLLIIIGTLLFITIVQRSRQKEMQFVQNQQKNDEEIYQLIQNQQLKIDDGRDSEKKRIARDLHDGIMNSLASTRLNLHLLNEDNTSQTNLKSIQLINGIQNIEKEIRNIAHDLNKEVFTNTDSFIAIVESLFEEQKRLFTTNCHFEIDKNINWDLIESTKKIHIYRILQEALNNINKHAHARNIIASILNRENDLLMEIYDDGIGFLFNEKKKGIGLQNIFFRTNGFKGTVEINSNDGAGTTLIITIPKNKT